MITKNFLNYDEVEILSEYGKTSTLFNVKVYVQILQELFDGKVDFEDVLPRYRSKEFLFNYINSFNLCDYSRSNYLKALSKAFVSPELFGLYLTGSQLQFFKI